MPRFRWNQISSLISEADLKGRVTLEFPSNREAKLFRWAVYNYRNKKNLEKSLSIILNDNIITIYHPIEVYVKKIEPKEVQDA